MAKYGTDFIDAKIIARTLGKFELLKNYSFAGKIIATFT